MDAYTEIIDALLVQLSSEIQEDKAWLWSFVYDDMAGEEDPQAIEAYIETVIKKGKIGWCHDCFKSAKQNQQDQDDYTLNPFEAEEGVVECKKCGSSKVYSVSVQTRAADEPMTTMAQCTVCKTKWSYNG